MEQWISGNARVSETEDNHSAAEFPATTFILLTVPAFTNFKSVHCNLKSIVKLLFQVAKKFC